MTMTETKTTLYAAALSCVESVLMDTDVPATATEIYESCTDLPEGFTVRNMAYGLSTVWADKVQKIPGKPNTYLLIK